MVLRGPNQDVPARRWAAPKLGAFLDLVGASTVGGTTLDEVVPRQPRFRLVGSGPLEQREILPETDAARKLLTSKLGPAIQQALRGALSTASRYGSDGAFEGIAMSDSPEGFRANELIEGAGESTVNLTNLVSTIPGGHATNRWINLSAGGTAAFIKGVAERAGIDVGPAYKIPSREAVVLLRHELQHIQTHPADSYAHLARLEEGIAETLALWPSELLQTTRDMGFDGAATPQSQIEARSTNEYSDERGMVESLLARAGIDVKHGDHFDAAEELLQSRELGEVPGALAQRIGEHEGLTAAAIEALARDIAMQGGGDPRSGWVAPAPAGG